MADFPIFGLTKIEMPLRDKGMQGVEPDDAPRPSGYDRIMGAKDSVWVSSDGDTVRVAPTYFASRYRYQINSRCEVRQADGGKFDLTPPVELSDGIRDVLIEAQRRTQPQRTLAAKLADVNARLSGCK